MFLNFNGKIITSDTPILTADSRGFRFGHGVFETVQVANGVILLEDYHFERLAEGLEKLSIKLTVHQNRQWLKNEIGRLLKKLNCESSARVRISISGEKGGIFESAGAPDIVIEAWPLDKTVTSFNQNGLVLGIYRGAAKAWDAISKYKTINALPYALAATHAKQEKWNDAILLNAQGCIADTTIANIYIVKDGIILTPALDQGCIAGVIRRCLIEKAPSLGIEIVEKAISIDELLAADEVFVTNAIRGIKWVAEIENARYSNSITAGLAAKF
jgi:branched-chain amino acid aminotransferase